MAGTKPKPVCLALQGGGAHGAFTWGVLDKLAEDGRLTPAAISASSAGAVNAAAWADGQARGGNDGARERLAAVWDRVAGDPTVFGAASLFAPFQKAFFGWLDAAARLTSPYNVNPLGLNPLRDALAATIDIESAKSCRNLQLFIAATNVRSGKAKIFEQDALSHDVILASACLPFLFQAVEIDGEHYWDGGYTANPALWPFFYRDTPDDIVIVHINPVERDHGAPQSAGDILNRVNEITFNASLVAELRAIDFVKRLHKEHWLATGAEKRYRDMRVHSIRADKALAELGADTKFRTDRPFLEDLRQRGRETAEVWLGQCFDRVGTESTADLQTEFLGRDK